MSKNIPDKICVYCFKPFSWRKKWKRDWYNVKYCSKRCHLAKKSESIKYMQIKSISKTIINDSDIICRLMGFVL